MISLFQIAPNDQSIYYLSKIFGVVGTLLPSGSPTLLLGVMFKTFNTFILTVGALVVVYVTVVGLLKTAQEGEFLGKHWNGLWVPLRTVFGIAALFPMSSGYCAIQVIFMWIIVQGIGAADVLWTTVLKFSSTVGNPTSTLTTPNTATINTQMKSLFQALVCQASAKVKKAPIAGKTGITPNVQYVCGTSPTSALPWCSQSDGDMLNPMNSAASVQVQTKNSAGNVTAIYIYNQYPIGPSVSDSVGICGYMRFCKDNSDPYCQAQQAALSGIVPVLGAIADQFVQYDYLALKLYEDKSYSSGDYASGIEIETWLQNFCSENNIKNCCMEGSNYKDGGEGGSCGINLSGVIGLNVNYAAKDVVSYLYEPALKISLGDPNLDFINTAASQYTSALMAEEVNQQARNIANTKNADFNSGAKSSSESAMKGLQNALNYGWIQAGSYLFDMVQLNSKQLSDFNGYFDNESDTNQNKFYVVAESDSGPSADTNALNNLASYSPYRFNETAAGYLVDIIRSTTSSSESSPAFSGGSSGSSATSFQPINDAISSVQGSLLNTFMLNLGGTLAGDTSHLQNSNPLVDLAKFGHEMMILAQVLFALVVVAVFGLTLAATINPMVLGTGLTMEPLGEAIKAIAGLLGPFFVMLVGGLYSLGVLLGIYVPLIPYIIFATGAIGWFIACVEAMVAAPIVALGILSPGGQHDILGRAEPAAGIMLSLFLRPSLMIVGLMAGTLVSSVVISLINSGFLHVVSSIMINQAPGLFEQLAFISVYVSLVVTVMSKSFSLIYTVPDRILLWIGMSHAAQYGTEASGDAVHGAKAAAESGAKEAAGAGQQTGAGVHGATMGVKQAVKHEEERKSASAAGAGSKGGEQGPHRQDGSF